MLTTQQSTDPIRVIHPDVVSTLATSPTPLTAQELREEALALFESGATDEAIAVLQEAVTRSPASTHAWNELGNMLAAGRRFGEAASAFRRALGRSPRSASLWNNLGAVLLQDQHPVGAECAFRRAIALQESFHEAHQNLAHLLDARGDSLEAARHHCMAFVLGPRSGKSPAMLGTAYYHLGMHEEAAQVYRDWLAAEPDNPVAQHKLNACLSEHAPDRVSDAYVETSFDAFAPSFDVHLEGLEYRGPELIGAALALALPANGDARILDVGCGTGLCAPVLQPWASELHGVDLSSGMLEQALARGGYTSLEKAELTEVLARHVDAYDVIVAADTFNYFGALQAVFTAAAAALTTKGVLVFTVEDGRTTCVDRDWKLAVHGRYEHAPTAIERWLNVAGFEIRAVQAQALRRELGRDVQALVYTAQVRKG